MKNSGMRLNCQMSNCNIVFNESFNLIFNRPGVAGAVLQTPVSLTDSLTLLVLTSGNLAGPNGGQNSPYLTKTTICHWYSTYHMFLETLQQVECNGGWKYYNVRACKNKIVRAFYPKIPQYRHFNPSLSWSHTLLISHSFVLTQSQYHIQSPTIAFLYA